MIPMGIIAWITEEWFLLLQGTGIVGSLWYAGRSLQLDARVRRVGHLMQIVEHHHRIWAELFERPELARIRETDLDLEKNPITGDEEVFVTQVIIHLAAVFEASRSDVIVPFDSADADIKQFFTRPIPRSVWNRKREFQNRAFVSYLDELLDS